MMPPVQVVNKRTVKMEFDVGKFGPSGLGGVDVWVTTDDGATWEKSGVDPNAMLPTSPDALNAGPVRGSVTLQLNQEGVTYGYYLVVKSKAGLGKPDPQPGEPPQVRVELDATPPEAVLIKPKADPTQPDTLILMWEATDKHLTSNPITLEWSAQAGPDGPWNVIGAAELPNTGQMHWKPPANVPPSVYLRLTVRDTAGNKAVAQTPKPELIDLSVPEVSNIGLGGVNANPPDPRLRRCGLRRAGQGRPLHPVSRPWAALAQQRQLAFDHLRRSYASANILDQCFFMLQTDRVRSRRGGVPKRRFSFHRRTSGRTSFANPLHIRISNPSK